jgi:hypothetical protein
MMQVTGSFPGRPPVNLCDSLILERINECRQLEEGTIIEVLNYLRARDF